MFWSDLLLLGIAAFTLLVLLTMLMSLYVWVPYVPTPWPVVRRMVELAEIKGDETVYDLGCGDARLLLEAKRKHPAIHAVGFELPLGIFLLAKLRVFLSRLPVEVHLRDFRKVNLAEADVIFLYLVPEVFAALERKLSQELRKGTRIVSHGFAFPEREPRHVERCPLPSWHFFKPRGKAGPRIFVYEW